MLKVEGEHLLISLVWILSFQLLKPTVKPLIIKPAPFLPFHSEEYHHQPQTVIYRIDTVLVVGSGIF